MRWRSTSSLGIPGMVDVVRALNLLLGLCLEVDGAARGQVVRHPQSGQLIYRFHYAMDEEHDVGDLIEAISLLTVEPGRRHRVGGALTDQ